MAQLWDYEDDDGNVYEGLTITEALKLYETDFEKKRQNKEQELRQGAQSAVDRTKQQIQQKQGYNQVADTMSGLKVNMPDGGQQPAKPSNLEQIQRLGMQQAGSAPMTMLNRNDPQPQARQLGQQLDDIGRSSQMNDEEIYSQNQLTDKYSEVPEVQNFLNSSRNQGLSRNVGRVSKGLSEGKYGKAGEDLNVTQLTGDFVSALSDAGLPEEAINQIETIIKNETKKNTGLGFTTMQKREDWNKIASMPDGPEKDQAIDDYMMIYAPGTKYPLTDKGIGEATTKAGATAGAGAAGTTKGRESAEQEILANTTIPGLKPIAGVRITEESVNNVKKVKPDIEVMTDLSQRLIDKYNKMGSVFTGDEAADYTSMVRSLQLLAKNQSLYNLGVLTGPDLRLLEEAIPNPASIKEGVKKQVLGDISVRLKNFNDLINSKANAYYKTNGFEADGKGESTPTKKSTPLDTVDSFAETEGQGIKDRSRARAEEARKKWNY